MSSYNTPKYLFILIMNAFERLIFFFSRLRRGYDSNDSGTPSPARFRSKRNRNDEK